MQGQTQALASQSPAHAPLPQAWLTSPPAKLPLSQELLNLITKSHGGVTAP